VEFKVEVYDADINKIIEFKRTYVPIAPVTEQALDFTYLKTNTQIGHLFYHNALSSDNTT